MDEGSISSLITVGLLILLHGALVAAYAALTNFRMTAVKERAESGDRGAKHALSLAENRSQLFVTYQLVLTAVRFTLVAVAVIRVAQPLIASQPDWLFDDPTWDYVMVLVPIGILMYALGDLIPYTLGNSYADQLLPFATFIMKWLTRILKPLVVVLAAMQKGVSEVSGGEELDKAITEEEILTLIDEGQRGGSIESNEKEMIYSVLQFNETVAREIMIPRQDITAIEISAPIEEVLDAIIESGHSRIPIYEGEIDNVKGILYAKDLLKGMHNNTLESSTVLELMRPPFLVPDTKGADDLLKEMKKSKMHIAVIVDEYGSTAGLVTIEDLVEEIVGDIKDEYDWNEDVEYVKLNENSYMLDGAMNINDINDMLEISLSTEDADTIGGFITSKLDSAPKIGDTVTTEEVILRVESVDNRRIRKAHLTIVEKPQPPEEESKPRITLTMRPIGGGSNGDGNGGGGQSTDARSTSFRLF